MGIISGKAKGNLLLYKNDILVYQCDNLYTDIGLRRNFAAWLAGFQPEPPNYVALGASNNPAPSVTATRVTREFARKEISGRSISFQNHHARLTAHFAASEGNGIIRQIGLFDTDATRVAVSRMDNTTGWSAATGITLTADTSVFVGGTGSLRMSIPASQSSIRLTHTGLGADVSSLAINSNAIFQIWLRPSAITNLTSIRVDIGNNASNFWRRTFATSQFTADAWMLAEIDTTTASRTGSPSLSSDIDYCRVEATMTSRSGAVTLNLDEISVFSPAGVLWNVAAANQNKTAGDVLNVVWLVRLEQDS